MKRTLLFVIALVTIAISSFAQCGPWVNTTKLRTARDTTWVKLWVDSTWGASSDYNWTLADGIVRPGFSVVCPVTSVATGQAIYTLSGTGCYETEVGYSDQVGVFNCDSLASRMVLSEPEINYGANIDSLSALTSVSVWDDYSWDTSFRANVHHDWGNGNVRSKTGRIEEWLVFGGPSDGANKPGYRYGGEYIIRDTFRFYVDTITCPWLVAQPYAYKMPGTNAPAITGTTMYCAGDTLRLTAHDTTMFHNMYHMIGSSVTGYVWNSAYWFTGTDGWMVDGGSYEPVYDGRPIQLYYTWMDRNLNVIGTDTVLVLAGIDSSLSGMVYLRTIDRIMGSTRFDSINISVSGPTISMDSAVSAPGCADTAKLCIKTNRTNDSVHITYLKDGIIQHAYGRTNAAGRIVLRNLSAGYYSGIQAHFIGASCASNILGSFILNKIHIPAPSFSSQVVCAGSAATLTIAAPLPGVEYRWHAPSGAISSGTSRVFASAATADAGYYFISGNVPGCLASDTVFGEALYVQTPPTPQFFSHTLCSGRTVSYWNGGTGFSTPDTSIVDVNGVTRNAGVVVVSSVVTNLCGATTYYDTITVLDAPALAPITGPSSVCGSDTVTFSTTNVGGTWGYGDGLRQAGAVPPSSIKLCSNYGIANSGYVVYSKTYANGCTRRVIKDFAIGGSSPYSAPDQYKGAFTGDTITIASPSSAAIYTGFPSAWSATPPSLFTLTAPAVVATAEQTGRGIITATGSNACGTRTINVHAVITNWLSTDLTSVSGNGNITEPHTMGEISGVTDAARDTAGNNWILSNNTLYLSDKNGILSRIAGQPFSPDNSLSWAYSGDGGPAANALLGGARRIFCDHAGNVYIVCGSEVIRKIGTDGIITRFAGVERSAGNYPFFFGYTGDGGPATNAKIYVNNATADREGNVYFTDLIHNVVRKINTAGIITTFAGNGSAGFGGDGGPATAALLGRPIGIAADTAGNIIVSSRGRLRKINTAGIITTIAGADGGTLNDTTALQIAPVFDGPVAVDKMGNIFSGTNYIRKIEPSGSITTTSFLRQYDGTYSTQGIDSNGNYLVHNYYGNPFFAYLYDVNYSYFFGYSSYLGRYYRNVQWDNGYNLSADDSGAVYTVSDGVYRKFGKPSVEIHASIDSSCGSTPVVFTAQGHNTGNTPSYTWRKNGIIVATDTIRYYDAAYTVGDTVTCTLLRRAGGRPLDTAYDKIVVYTVAPLTATILSAPASLCSGTSASLSGMPAGGTWVTSAALVAGIADSTVSALAAGTALVSYTISNACGSASDTQSITVLPLANAGYLTGDAALCTGSATLLAASQPGGIWSGTSGSISVTALGVATGVHAGTDTIRYIVTNTCNADTALHVINVLSVPAAGAISGATSLCIGNTATLVETATGGTWSSTNTGVASVSSSGYVTTGAAGSTTIGYSTANVCGTTTDTFTLTVNTLPDAGTITGAASVCAGNETSLSVTATGGTWSATTGAASVSASGWLSGVAGGSDTIRYTVVNACGAAAAMLQVTVNTLPSISGIAGADTLCQGETAVFTISGTSGTWASSNSAVASVSATGAVAANTPGSTFISYAVANMCGTASATHYLYVRSLADCTAPTTVFNIYPNPSTGTFTVQLPAPVSNATITIADVSGKVITTLTTSQANTLVDMSTFPSATYILTIVSNGTTYRNKVVLW